MKKITSKQVFTYVLLLGIIAVVAVYFLVYKKNVELADQKNASNATLNQRVKALEQYHIDEPKYLEEMEPMKKEIDTRFADARKDGKLHLLAASSASETETAEWVKEIEAAFPDMKVFCSPLSLGVSCHTGTGALGIGCAVVPDYKA